MSEDVHEWEIETYATDEELWAYAIYHNGEKFHSTTDGGWAHPSRREAHEAAKERIESHVEGRKPYTPRRDFEELLRETMHERMTEALEPQIVQMDAPDPHPLWWVLVALAAAAIGAAITGAIYAWTGC